MLATIFLHLSVTQRSHCGRIAQAGAIRILINLSLEGSLKGRMNAAHALANVLIPVNPNLALTNGLEYEVIRPLFSLTRSEGEHVSCGDYSES